MLKPGELFHNRYYLKEMKGRGSFGEVWLARDQELDADVAIKVYIALDTRGIGEFKSEYKTTMGLYHPNLLKADHFDICDNRPYLVMPFCPDSSINLIGKIDEPTVWKFLLDVASGLEYLHRMGVIHHDIKPDNVLINENGDFVITDFGISVRIRSTLRRNSSRQVQTDLQGGSLAYMAPEMFTEEAGAVNATDIWALGATLYEMMTGNLPFFGQSGVMQLKGAAVPELPGPYSQKLKSVVQKCLAKETWDRPTAKQLTQYAREAIEGGGSPEVGRPPEVVKNTVLEKEEKVVLPKKKNTKLVIFGIVGALVLMLVVGIGIKVIQRNKAQRIAAENARIEAENARIAKFVELYNETVTSCDMFINNIVKDRDGNEGNKHFFVQALKALQEIEKLEQDPDFNASGIRPVFKNKFAVFIEKMKEAEALVNKKYKRQLQYGLVDDGYTKELKERLDLMRDIIQQSQYGSAVGIVPKSSRESR